MWSTVRIATLIYRPWRRFLRQWVIGIEFPAMIVRGRLFTQRSGDCNCGNTKSIAHG